MLLHHICFTILSIRGYFEIWDEMANQITKGYDTVSVETANICAVCPSSLDVRKCRIFWSFGRPSIRKTININDLKEEVETKPCQTIEEHIPTNQPYKNICRRLEKLAEQHYLPILSYLKEKLKYCGDNCEIFINIEPWQIYRWTLRCIFDVFHQLFLLQ